MDVNQIETYYQQISSQGLTENSDFLMRLSNLWGEDCLELPQGEKLSCE